MDSLRKHWTSDDTNHLVYRVAFDFVAQLERHLDNKGVTRLALARKLSVSKGRVSQVLNDPGNLELRTALEYARALGKKVALVAYDDGDADNRRGPVNCAIFEQCWKALGSPRTSLITALAEKASTEESADLQHRYVFTARTNEQKRIDRPSHVDDEQSNENRMELGV